MYKNKRILLCIIACASLIQASHAHADVTSDSFFSKVKNASSLQWAALAAGAIGTAVLGKLIYNLLFGLTDLQEIEQALTLLENAQGMHDEMSAHYYTPCTIFRSMTLNNAQLTEQESSNLKQVIVHSSSRRPYYTYVSQLDAACSRLKAVVNEISNRKIQIFDRKIAVIKDTKKYDELTRKDVIKQFNDVISRCTSTQTSLRNLHDILHKIRNYVIHLHEYENEYTAARIEALENEIRQLKLSWPQPCTHTHYHITKHHSHDQAPSALHGAVGASQKEPKELQSQNTKNCDSSEKDMREAYESYHYLSTL